MSLIPYMMARDMGKAVTKPMNMVRFLVAINHVQTHKARGPYIARGMFFPGRGISSAI